MTTDQIISLASSVGTCAATTLVFATLIEMAKQRRSSYLPDIFPSSQIFTASKSNLCALSLPISWSKNHEVDIDSYNLEYLICLNNIGNGAAKNIEIKWNIETIKFLDLLNESYECNDTNTNIEISNNNFLHVIEDGKSVLGLNMNVDLKKNIDHLLPASVDKCGVHIKLPLTFVVLSSYAFKIFYKKKEQVKSDNKLIFPWLGLTISYTDIGGKRHVKGFNTTAELIMFSENYFGGELGFKQTSP